MRYLGDFAPGETVIGFYMTVGLSGGSITRATDGTLSVYKDNNDTQTTTGVTSGEDTDSMTGVHRYAIATTDSFYAAGSQFFVVLSGAVIDGQTVNTVVGYFTIGRTGLFAAGTLSGTHSATTADLGANAPSISIVGQLLWFPAHKVARTVDAYDTGTGVATFESTGATLVDGDKWFLVGTPPASTTVPIPVNVTQNDGTPITAAAGIQEVKVESLSAAAIDSILDDVIENSTTMRQLLRGFAAALLGKASGLETTEAVFRDTGDTKDRITATVDADGNRTAVTLDLT